MPLQDPKITVQEGDVLRFPCNVLILKYAQWWHGADLAVANAIGAGRGWDSGGSFLAPGDFKVLPGDRKIAAEHVLFEGVQELRSLNYSAIRGFGRRSIIHAAKALPDTKHIAMTMHGVNFGMDERESFLSQLGGVLEALSDKTILPLLEEISIVEKNVGRAKRLQELLSQNYSPRKIAETNVAVNAQLQSAGNAKNEKPHAFVAMPFSPEFEDVFIFGIQEPVQQAGLLCERVDMDIFTGDIVERIKSRIESAKIVSAKIVIADLTGTNANVYLEVGYAWGCDVPTLLLCRNPDELKFDVKSQRCLIYSSINDLRKKLSAELKVHID